MLAPRARARYGTVARAFFDPRARLPPPPRRNRFEMRIHKRIIDLHSPAEVVKQITAITIDPSVQVEVSVADAKQSK